MKNNLFNKEAFQKPARVVEPYSWIGHIPFLQWLIAESKPITYVELGVHTGNSFCAAADALRILSQESKCYAVDTWEGDHQAGYYGEDVHKELKEYIYKNRYNNVTLIRKDFNAAVCDFSDESIDLLHIDGLHTYEAVKNDYETWLPKMSSKGIILFHDIEVKEQDFGVWKLWDELIDKYPSFSFKHYHGLGVLFVGKISENKINDLKNMAEKDKDLIRGIFSALGDKIHYEKVKSHLDQLCFENNILKNKIIMLDCELLEARKPLHKRMLKKISSIAIFKKYVFKNL